MGDNGPITDRAVLLRSLGRLAGALAAAGRNDHDAAGELFFALHLLYVVPHSPIFAVMYREGPAMASHARNFVPRVERAWQAEEQCLKNSARFSCA
ncbi:hypothetical protein Q1M63_25610 [Sinorhizobium meliloti]|nr:hypothetical protein Q1M63_25610 [Sinorhizobium meliloti]